jgi:glycosyltransferase involved in cell wall biosynthesis
MKSVAVYVHSSELGGAEQSTLTLLRHLDRSRWSPTLIHHAAPALAGMLEETARLGVPDLVVPEIPDGWLGLRRCAAFSRVLRDRGFDVFHAQLTWPLSAKFALAAAAAARIRAVVATVHSYPEFTMTRTTAIQQRVLGHAVGCYIAVSRDLAEKLHARMRWSRERIVVVYNATEVPSEQRSVDPRLRAELAGPHGRPVVLAMARLVRDKGLDLLVEAAAALPHAQFVIAGDGPARSALAAQVSELALDGRVKLLGWRTDTAALLAAADLFVLPSRNEALGVSALEAMAAGKPVIATAVGGVPEAVCDGETGLIVPPGDSQALAGAISALIADPARCERFGAAGRKRVRERFSTCAMATAVEGVYERLLDRHLAGPRRRRRTPL